MTIRLPLVMLSRPWALLARGLFGAVVVLSPFRLRAILVARDLPAVWHDYTDLRAFAVDVALAALLVAWAATLLAERRRPGRVPVAVAAAGLGLLGLVWAGVPGSLDPALSAAGALELTGFGGLAWYAATELRFPRDLAFPVALMVGLQSIVAIAQAAVQGSVGLGALGEIALDPDASGIGIVASEAGVRLLRGYGLSDHPNILGGLLALGLIVLVGAFASGQAPRAGRLPRLALVVAIALGVLALGVTFSRAAWIALVTAAIAAAVLTARYGRGRTDAQSGRESGWRAARPWLALAGAVPFVVAALALPLAPFLAARLGVATEPPAAELRSIDERIWLAGAALEVVGDHPLLGAGLGTLPQAMVPDPGLPYRPQPAHLVPLTIAAEDGIPAAIAFCLLLLAAVTLVVRTARRGGAGVAPAAMALGLLAAITVVSSFDYYPWVFPAGRTWLAIAIGAAVGRESA